MKHQSKLDPAKVYVVIPVYNESKTILQVIEQVRASGFPNIIVVNDGSTDDTKSIVAKCKVHLVSHSINRGVGAATQTGFDIAKELGAHIVVTIDGDGQFNTNNIHTIAAPLLERKADVVIGSRFLQKNKIPILRRFYNFLASIITFFLAGVYVKDSQSGLKGLSKEALEVIEIHTSGFEYSSEVIREIGHNNLEVLEVPVDVYYTKESMKKGQSFAAGIKTTFKLFIRSLMR